MGLPLLYTGEARRRRLIGMRVSQFEIYRLVQRALEGLGSGYGVDRDAARTIAWLEARGLPGLARLDADLAELDRGIRPPTLESGTTIDAGGGSAIAFASAVLDLLGARAATGVASLRLRRCRSPLFLIPAAVESRRGFALTLSWRGPDGDIAARVDGGGRLKLFLAHGQGLPSALLDPVPRDIDLRAAPAAKRAAPLSPGLGSILDGRALARRLAHSLDHGIEVDPALWRRIDAVAARVQVPASAESRLKGAGGGDANA